MKLLCIFLLIALCVIQSELVGAAICNADNCLRAVRASKSLARGSADCSSFFKYTVTPATSSVTVTIAQTSTITATDIVTVTSNTESTITTVITVGAALVARQVTASPFAIPTYASACSGISRYSSACSCLGIQPSTITIAAPSTTIFEIVYVTATVRIASTSVSVITDVKTVTTYTCPPSLPSQVVVNPGFEQGLAPWTTSRTGGSVALRLSYCGLNKPGADCQLTGNGCSCGFVNADSPGGTATYSQVLQNVCPGQRYSFTAYVGISDNIIAGSTVETTVAAYLDGVQIFAPFLPCGNPNTGCPLAGGSGPYVKLGPLVVIPARMSPVLELRFVSTIDPSKFSIDVFIDDITLTRI